MKKAEHIKFTRRYQKLQDKLFHTVRWTDTSYVLGKTYQVLLGSYGGLAQPYGEARIVKMELRKMSDLTDVFIRKDAECDRQVFFELMKDWYGKKPNWKGWDSEIQVIWFRRI